MEIVKSTPKALNKIVNELKAGKIVVCPTDTVYGLLCDSTSKKAVNKIFKIKQRPRSKPLPVFVKDLKMAKKLAKINEKQEKVLKKHWPGKYTFVLKRKPGINLYGIDRKTIALRIPKYKFLNDLLKKINKPLVQTSVNISGEPPLTKINDILERFGRTGPPMIIIDRGELEKSKPSKIIDLTAKNLTRLR